MGTGARGVSVRGKFVLSRNLGYKTKRLAMWLNVVQTPGSLPRSQCSVLLPPSFCRETRGTKLGCRHVAKRRSDPRVAYTEVKVQVRDLAQVVGIVVPFAPRGVSICGNTFYRAPGCTWAQETCVGCPQQRYASGESGKVQGWDRVGIVEVSCGYWARGISILGKYV